MRAFITALFALCALGLGVAHAAEPAADAAIGRAGLGVYDHPGVGGLRLTEVVGVVAGAAPRERHCQRDCGDGQPAAHAPPAFDDARRSMSFQYSPVGRPDPE